MSLRTRLVSGSLYTLLSSLGVYAIAMVTTIIYARLLPPEEFGVLGIFLTLGSTIAPFATLGLNVAMSKFIAQHEKSDPSRAQAFLSVALTLNLVSSGALSVGYFLVAEPLAAFYGKSILAPMIRLSALFVLLSTLVTLAQSLLQGLQAIRRLAALSLVVQLLAIPTVYASVSAFGLFGAAVGGAIFVSLSIAITVAAIRPLLRARGFRFLPAWETPVASRLLRFSAPLLLSNILMRPALLFVATLLALWVSFPDLADYRVATSLYRVVLLLPAVLSVPLLPAISEAYATQAPERTRFQLTLLLRITMFLGLPLALLVGLGAPLWIRTLYGSDYAAGAVILYVLSLAAMIDTLGSVCENTFIGTERTWLVLGLNVFQVTTLVFGSVLLIRQFGVLGAAYATVLSSVVYFAGALVELGRRHEIAGKDLWDLTLLTVIALVASALLVLRLGLGDYLPAAVLFAIVIVVLVLRLTARDRFLISTAIRGVFGTRGAGGGS